MNRNIRKSLWIAIATIVLAAGPVSAITSTTVVMDGDFSDWTAVLIDPENALADAGGFAGDPDNPSADRDLRGFAFTWDDANLYFWWRRTLSGTNTITFSVFIDRDFDGLMSSTDVVARFRYQGGEFKSSELVEYDDGGSPDLITGDGVPMPGGYGASLPAVQDGAGSLSGILLEGSIDWASLGVSPGSPLNFHIAAGTNNNSEDNLEPFDSLYGKLEFSTDRVATGIPGQEVWIPHTVRNEGNAIDVFDLRIEATQLWDHSVYTDPDGDGDPSDGERIALDANGDGDYEDPFDIMPAPSYDADGNGIVDSGLLSPGAEFSFVLGVRPPLNASNGEIDVATLTARSRNVALVQETVTDVTTVGILTLQPDGEGVAEPGASIFYAATACNRTGQSELLDLAGSSVLGWNHGFHTDPNGDGDPADGQPLVDSNGNSEPDLILPSGQCVPFVVEVFVDGAATLGEVDTLQIAATGTPSSATTELFAVTTASQGVSLDPDRAADVQVGGTVFYTHKLVNGTGQDEIYDLLASSSLGSTLTIFPDPDGDGIPEDELPITETSPVSANGGSYRLVIRAEVPNSALHADQDIVQLQATARGNPGVFDTVTNTTSIQNLLTFSDPLFARPSTDFFGACAPIYAEGSGVSPNADFRFIWNDPDTFDGAEQTTGIRKPDADGRVDDVYALSSTDLPGIWNVRMQIRSGSNWANLPVGGARTFEVFLDGGVISSLQPGKIGFFIQGESLTVNTVLDNPTAIDFTDTLLRYVVFEDQNQDGLPTDGEPYVLQDGSSGAYSAGGFTFRTPRVQVLRGQQFQDFWRITNVRFPTSGTWTVYVAWEMSCGVTMDEWTSSISVCSVLPPVDAGASGPVCRGVPRAVGTPSQPGHSYRWYPEDDLNDASLAQPLVDLTQDRSYTLVMVEDATGCSNTDSLDLQVVDPPAPDVTPDGPVINVGGTVSLDAGVSGLNYIWSTVPSGQPGDGATTQTVDVGPTETTTYSVTVIDGFGCQGSAQETVTVNPNPPQPAIQFDPDTICLGTATTLDAGVAVAEYLWSSDPAGQPGDGATTRSIQVSPSETTTYSVLVTDGFGQQGSDSGAVTVLTTTPGSVGYTLRVTKQNEDVGLNWQAIPDAWAYNVYRSAANDYTSPVLQGGDASLAFTDTGAIDGTKLYLYQIHGSACFEGPR